MTRDTIYMLRSASQASLTILPFVHLVVGLHVTWRRSRRGRRHRSSAAIHFYLE
jgi:hypothetical protein